MSKNILVTGGNGFLGKVLITKLQAKGYTTTTIDSKNCDLSQPAAIEYLQSIPSDFVFHLAGKTGIALSWQNPLAYYRANTDTTQHVLEYCRTKKIPMHYVSGYIYGNQGPIAITEQMAATPNTPYAHSKWMGEELCRFYAHFFSLSITISRPFNIYGPNQRADFFIPRMIEQISTQAEIRAFNLKRDYIFVEDVAEALISIMERGKRGQCYNIGSGQSLSCAHVIEALQKLMGTQKPIVLEKQHNVEEILYTQADISKIEAELGWQPKHSLLDGLSKCLSQLVNAHSVGSFEGR